MVLKRTVENSVHLLSLSYHPHSLTSESVESTALTLESVYNVHSSHGLPLGVLSVGDGVTDDVFQEHLENSTSFFVDEPRDTLDSTTSSKTPNGWFGDALDVITKNFPVSLGASFTETLSAFSSTGHDGDELKNKLLVGTISTMGEFTSIYTHPSSSLLAKQLKPISEREVHTTATCRDFRRTCQFSSEPLRAAASLRSIINYYHYVLLLSYAPKKGNTQFETIKSKYQKLSGKLTLL